MALKMAQPWKDPLYGIYYFRVRVPRDVAARIGRDIEKISLRTKNPAEARYAFAREMAAAQARWQEARKGIQILTDRQIEALAGEIYRGRRASLPDEDRDWTIRQSHGFARWGLEMILGEEPYPAGHPDAGLPLWQRAETAVGAAVAKVLKRNGLTITEPSYQRLLVAAARSTLQAVRQGFREAEGDWRPDPDAERFPSKYEPAAADQIALGFEKFWEAATKGYGESTKRRWAPIVPDLLAFSGKRDICKLTPADIEAWRDATIEAGKKSARTFARNDLAALKTLFGNAVEDKLMLSNPAKDIKVRLARRQKAKAMRGFTDEEASLVLAATTAPPPQRTSPHIAVAMRWVPWICAYTGARVNEVTQARVGDIKKVDGVWCLHITPEAGTQKTETERDVPIHQHLLDMGILSLVAGKTPDTKLFTKNGEDEAGAPQRVGAKLAGWVRSLGIDDTHVWPNHGWRHRFKTVARSTMPEQFSDALLGHAPATQGRKYGAFPAKILAEHIASMPRFEA